MTETERAKKQQEFSEEVERQNDEANRQELATVINQLEIYIEDAHQISRSVEEAFTRSAYADIARHAEELEKLAQKIRQGTVDLPPDESRIIRIMVSPLQHSALELRGAANSQDHEDAHHAFEGLEEELETLEKEIQRYSPASG